MRIDIELTYDFIDSKQLKSLAFALLIKDCYQSSTIKDYTINGLRNKLKDHGYNFHHSTINKYIKVLNSHGLLTMGKNTLTVNKLYHGLRNTINIKRGRAQQFKDYIHHLRGAILKDKYLKAKFIQSKLLLSKKKMENLRSHKDLKICKNIDRKFNNYKTDEQGFKYKQSILSMCKEFNCSVMELYATINYLVKKGYLTVTNNIQKLCSYIGGSIPDNCFIYNGSIYLAECNYYSINIDSKK